MDRGKLGQVISAGIASGEALEAEQLLPVFSDSELFAEFERRQLANAHVAGSLAVNGPETETPVEAVPVTSEDLLATLDTALDTYNAQLDVANNARIEVRGRKNKPASVEAVPEATIVADVEALVADPAILAELQAELDHFTKNPEAGSPEAGFDLVIVPEGLTPADEEAIARDLQAKLPSDYDSPYIRPARYNDPRQPEVTGKGYRIAFAPRHYNVPTGTTTAQTDWMIVKNQRTEATELQTATDAEALAQATNLFATGELDEPSTRFDKTYTRRFDQEKLFGDYVSRFCVYGDARVFLGGSDVHSDGPTRALVVPKA